MEFRDLKDYEELRACIKLIADQHYDPLFPLDEPRAFSKMFQYVKSGCFVKTIYHENKLVGIGTAYITNTQIYCSEMEVSLLYYQTTLKGFMAVKAMKAFHKLMIEWARTKKVAKCCSSSMMASQDTWIRILQQEGWIRRGGLMVYPLDYRDTDILGPGWRDTGLKKPQSPTRLPAVRFLRDLKGLPSPAAGVSPGLSMQDSDGPGEGQHLIN